MAIVDALGRMSHPEAIELPLLITYPYRLQIFFPRCRAFKL